MKTLIFVTSFLMSLAAVAPAVADSSDIGMCYAEVNCTGSIVGARVPVSICVQQKAKSFYSLLNHTCTAL